jgi:hypothetical protein
MSMEESWITIAIVVLAFPAFIVGLRILGWWSARNQEAKDENHSDS